MGGHGKHHLAKWSKSPTFLKRHTTFFIVILVILAAFAITTLVIWLIFDKSKAPLSIHRWILPALAGSSVILTTIVTIIINSSGKYKSIRAALRMEHTKLEILKKKLSQSKSKFQPPYSNLIRR